LPFLFGTNVWKWLNQETRENGKDKKYAHMGFSCIFEYHNEKGSIVADFGLRSVFHLLHSLVPVFPKP